MKAPILNRNEYSVLIAEYSTGIIYNKGFNKHSSTDNKENVYQVFQNFDFAINYVKSKVQEQNKFEFVIHDYNGEYLCKIDKTSDLKKKVYFLERLQQSIHKIEGKIEGVSKNDILLLEQKLEIKLPIVYKEFLFLMGTEANHILCGQNYRYHELIALQEEADEILFRRTNKHLPKNTFVFFVHQNYSFAFFYLNHQENPATFLFVEPEESAKIEPHEDSFSNFIFKELDNYLNCKGQINKEVEKKKEERVNKSKGLLEENFMNRILFIIVLFILFYLFLH